ncbi:hypothetical protein GTP55_26305 [Duganella sp. FT109W]|uniref:Response regulator n=1 Tax=Duganella margarita TaxID=2692170 RepID=A0ABW9WRS9_9BURK|nr:hypothetical protein [Duganella margarita]MYN42860.1 hypothetical protein [Duganella margarita]
MKTKLKLLIVEDDAPTIAQWKIEVEIKNAEQDETGYEILLHTAVSLEEATAIMADHNIDAAIVDINLRNSGRDASNKDGNIVVDNLLNSELAVVAVLSGEPAGSANPPNWAKNVPIFGKGQHGIRTAMNWLISQIPVVKQIKISNAKIKKEMVNLFTRSIWPRWNRWVETGQDGRNEFTDGALTRHLTAHVYSAFLEEHEHRVHPEEWYFIPAIRNDLRTGDLIKRDDGVVEILITPRCDLARNGKNETLQWAECKDVAEEWDKAHSKIATAQEKVNNNKSMDEKIIEDLNKNLDKARGQFRQFSQHKGNSSVYHFLPRLSLNDGTSLGPFFINFDKIRSVLRSDTEAVQALTSQKFASITPEFLPSIIERLGSYFSRFGTPDYFHPD